MGNRYIRLTAIRWALDEAPGIPARLVSTLIAVASFADDDGRGAYPSAATVAAITRKSESQAKRDIAELTELGLLKPGDQRLTMDIRADKRTKVYDLTMPRGASGRTPRDRPRGASGNGTGCIPPRNGVRPDAPEEEFLKNSGRSGRDAESAPPPPARHEDAPPMAESIASLRQALQKSRPLIIITFSGSGALAPFGGQGSLTASAN